MLSVLFHRFRFGLQLPLVLEESLCTSRARFHWQFAAGVWILRFKVQRLSTRPWSARFRHRLRAGEVLCTGLEVCLVRNSGVKDSRSAEARTWIGKGACRGFRSCRVSFSSLPCSCESESQSSQPKWSLAVWYFLLVTVVPTSSTPALLWSVSSCTRSRGPPKRTLWRKWKARTEASAVCSIAICQCYHWISRSFKRDCTWEESIIPRIPTINGNTCTTHPCSV